MAVKTTRPRANTQPKAKPAKVLVVETKAGDWQSHQDRLGAAGFEVETVTFGVRASKRLEMGGVDLLVIDGSAAATKARNLLAKIRKSHSPADLPVIMVTPASGSAEIVEALEAGANDCVAMPLDRPVLAARMRAQINAKEALGTKNSADPGARGSVDWLHLIMDNATTAIFETGEDGVITRMNVAASYLAGRDSGELIGKTFGSIFVDESDRDISSLLSRVAVDGYFVSNHPARLRDEFGEERVLSVSLRRIGDDSRPNGVVATAEDLTETWRRRTSPSLPVDRAIPERTPPPASAAPKLPETIVGRALSKGARDAAAKSREEHRADARHRVFKGAKLSFNNDGSLMDCIVRDISDSGAKLVFESYFDCPRLVRLRISDGRAFDCEVRWFANKTMGVSFLTRVEESG